MNDDGDKAAALPKWAERGFIPPKTPRPSTWTRFRLPLGLLGAVIFASLVGGAFVVGRSTPKTASPSPSVTVAPPKVTAAIVLSTTVVPSTTAAPATTVSPPTTVSPKATIAPSATVAPSTTVPPVATTTPPLTVAVELLPPRTAVFTQGKIYLRGAMPSQAAADIIITKAANVLGRENVIVEYVFDSRASLPTEGSLQVADTVLFAPSSADLAPDFLPILNLGVILLAQNPKITIDIVGHTDSDGTDENNLALAKRRCDAVIAYLAAAGVDPARLVSVPKGASEPIADNADPEGRRLNRRAEFIIRGLLDN
jgi:outer membrane protein OmpA-like peptidoglycan-associated protein